METKEQKMWGIHSGSLGEMDSKFLSKSNPYISIGWYEIGDLMKIPAERDKFKESIVFYHAKMPKFYHNEMPTIL